MLIIVLLLCLLTSIYVAARRRDSLAVYLLGMNVSNLVMLSGIVIYIAKMGGTAARESVFLFLLTDLQVWLQYLPLPLGQLGYLVALGRTLFPLFAFYAALELTMISALRRRSRQLRIAAAVPALLSLIFYFPDVFYAVVDGRYWLLPWIIVAGLVWVVLYLAVSMLLLIQEYRSTTMPIFKRNTRYILLSFLCTSALYLIYATKDPTQIYHMFLSEYIRHGFTSYISASLPEVSWIVLGLCTVFVVVLGSYNLMCYTKLVYDDSRQDAMLERKFDTAGLGVSVFVHGAKNQLLSIRVLNKKLSRALEPPQPDLEEIRAYVRQLHELNEGLLGRMDELYRTVKSNSISLVPISSQQLAEASVRRFHDKYPNAPVTVEVQSQRQVLADESHLSEAVCNLLCNGYEAAAQHSPTPQVALRIRNERMWTIVSVEDNGPGIPPETRNHIFDTFFTSKNTNYNWGMGLYYVRKIVRSHLGRLRLENRTGGGTVFLILLPAYDARRREREP